MMEIPKEPLSYEQASQWVNLLARERAQLVDKLRLAVETAAQTEASYHEAKAKAMVRLRAEKVGVTEAQERVKGEVVVALENRELANHKVTIFRERLATVDAQRASLHRMIEWSMTVLPD